MGGSAGKSKGSSNNSFSTNVWGPQGDALQNLYQLAFNQFGKGNDYMSQITGQANNINNAVNGILDANKGLQSGGAYGDTAEIRQKLLDSMGGRSNVGSMYESIVGGSGNTYVDPLIERLRADSAQNVSTLQGSNAMDAAAMGQSGSSRQAMQDAMFSNQANKDLLNKEAELRHGAYDTDLGLKMGIAQQADYNRGAEQDRLLAMLQGGQGSMEKGTGTDLLSTLLNSGMNPWLQAQQAVWNPMNNLSNIIGNAIMTGSGSGSSKSKGGGISGSLFG